MEMAATENNWKFHTLLTVHQNPDTPDTGRWKYNPTSEVVVFHKMRLLPIYVNQEVLTNIKTLKEDDYRLSKYVLLLITNTNTATVTAN